MSKKKSDIQVRISVYNLIPETKSIRSLKKTVLLLHSYRIIKKFLVTAKPLKDALLATAKEISDNNPAYFESREFDCNEYAEFFDNNNVSKEELDYDERQEALEGEYTVNADNIYRMLNLRNRDHKALGKKKFRQQLASHSNSIRIDKSNFRLGFFFVTNIDIDEFTTNLNAYLEGDMSEKNMKLYLDKIIKK